MDFIDMFLIMGDFDEFSIFFYVIFLNVFEFVLFSLGLFVI